MARTDKGYERAAKQDPYFAVIPFSQFRRTEFSLEHRAEFFAIGERHVAQVLEWINIYFDPQFRPRRVLDFGCGVGRLAIPFARRSGQVVGIDISPTMLREAKANCEHFDISNAEFILGDDELSRVSGTFDLVHSTLVFQHIPVRRVRQILKRLLDRLEPSSFGSLQFLVSSKPALRVGRLIKRTVPLGNQLANFLKRRPWKSAYIDLFPFAFDEIAQLLCERGANEIFAVFDDPTDGNGDRSVHITFRLPPR